MNKRFRETQMSAPRISPTTTTLFVGFAESSSSKSPRSFDAGAVGLRIVAAMSGDSIESGPVCKVKAKSDPIPIRARVGPNVKVRVREKEEEEEDDDVELSESYTCVISHVGGGTVRKRVNFDDGLEVVDGIGGKFERNSGVFFESPPAAAASWVVGPTPGDFLSCCYLCRKKLHGLDIFMYRGEKAFCSVECRSQQILSDERKEKCRSEAGKPHESSLSPYPSSLPFAAGVAAA